MKTQKLTDELTFRIQKKFNDEQVIGNSLVKFRRNSLKITENV